MEKQVIYRDRQEVQSADLNNTQTHAADSMQHIVADGISSLKHYTGLAVTALSATEINVGSGRLYSNGKVYTNEQDQEPQIFQYLPLATKRILTVAVGGDEVETNVEPRDFLIDIESGVTEPQAVAMQLLRKATVTVVAGEESVAPQVPALSTDLLAVAYITLTTTGIDNIEMITGNKLPNLREVDARVTEAETWRNQAEPKIASIASDLSALADRTDDKADRTNLVEMGRDIARLKETQNLPDTYSSYGADDFTSADETDEAGAGYAARVDNGVLFPHDASDDLPIALSNPNEPAVYRSADDVVLPKFTNIARIQTTGYSGDISCSAYQTQNLTVRKYVQTHRRIHYGWCWNWRSAWWRLNWAWRNSGLWFWRKNRYIETYTTTSYKLEETTSNINGTMVAQTLLVSNAMWLTKVGLFFTDVGETGDVNLLITETVGGKPVLEQTLTSVTVPQADMVKYPTETAVTIPPVLLESGKRYAIVIVTQGDHRMAVVSGNDYTQGTLFFGTDGDYFVGDLTKDMMFTLYAAKFSYARTEVELQSVELAGGMTDIDVNLQQVIPDGCELDLEIRVGGTWYRLDDGIDHLSGAPNLVQMRAVFLGTTDLAPALTLAVDAATVSRPTTQAVHWSSVRNLAAASEDVTVHLVLAGYSAADHTVTVQLVDGANTYDATGAAVEIEEDEDSTRLTFSFTPEVGVGIASYQIKTTVDRSAGTLPPTITERSDVAV